MTSVASGSMALIAATDAAGGDSLSGIAAWRHLQKSGGGATAQAPCAKREASSRWFGCTCPWIVLQAAS